ncbi:MAG TPA: hemerythrin domain-containing protein [Methylomirabilota bacterium]|jgi:hemerythrin superfamily protein|nr:hemerythrin domain-containing protein [Methylomirabilota bacterium]
MNATRVLRRDHEAMRELFFRLQALSGAEQRLEALREVASDLVIHARIEDDLFYSALETAAGAEADRLVDAARGQHERVEDLIERLIVMDGRGEEFDRGVAELQRNVEDHVRDEEARIFALAERTLGPARLEEIGRAIEERRLAFREAA